jgi:hypothetical protein
MVFQHHPIRFHRHDPASGDQEVYGARIFVRHIQQDLRRRLL